MCVNYHCGDYLIFFYFSGVIAFIGLASFLLSRPSNELQLQEKLVFACFFIGAITCMGLSFLYHTLCCNKNKKIGRLFAKYVYNGYEYYFNISNHLKNASSTKYHMKIL